MMKLRILRASLAVGGVALGIYGYHLLREDLHSPAARVASAP